MFSAHFKQYVFHYKEKEMKKGTFTTKIFFCSKLIRGYVLQITNNLNLKQKLILLSQKLIIFTTIYSYIKHIYKKQLIITKPDYRFTDQKAQKKKNMTLSSPLLYVRLAEKPNQQLYPLITIYSNLLIILVKSSIMLNYKKTTKKKKHFENIF